MTKTLTYYQSILELLAVQSNYKEYIDFEHCQNFLTHF